MERIFYLLKQSLFTKLALVATLVIGGGNSVWGDTVIFGGTIDTGWTFTTITGETSYPNSNGELSSYGPTGIRYYTSNDEVTIVSGQTIAVSAKLYGSTSSSIAAASVKLYYSSDNGNTWNNASELTKNELTNSYQVFSLDGIIGTYKLRFELNYVLVNSIIIKDAPTSPVLAVTHPIDGDAFGYVTTNTTKTYTITNEGVGSMDVSISSDNDAFSLSTFSLMDITNDGIGKTFNVTFNYDSSILEPQKAIITVTPTFEGGVVQSFEVSAGPDVVCNEDKAASWTTGQGKNVYVKYTASEGWNTISFPFAPNAYKSQLFGNSATLKSYALKSYDNGVLTFENASYLGAGTPYLIYAQNVSSSNFVVTGVNVGYTAGGSVTKSGAKFQGTFATKTYQSGDDWYGVTSSGQVLQAGEGAYVKGYRAYFTGIQPPTNGARVSIVLEGDGTTTDLGFVKMVDSDAKDVYTLSGQKVQKAGKGLYIVNGRKVVIK